MTEGAMKQAWLAAAVGRSGAVRAWVALVALGLPIAGGLMSCSDSGPGCETGLVDTTSGTVCGTIRDVVDLPGAQTDTFLGIPFGESTAGANRWAPPIPKARVQGVFAATE